MTATAYYVERDADRWALFCAPGDDGTPSRHVDSFPSEYVADEKSKVLQYIVRRYGPVVARECEAVACRIGAYGEKVTA